MLWAAELVTLEGYGMRCLLVPPTILKSSENPFPGHGILQGRILEWVAIPFSRGSSRPRDQTWISCTAGRFFTIQASLHIFSSNIRKSIQNHATGTSSSGVSEIEGP